jgi:hypothetical protein
MIGWRRQVAAPPELDVLLQRAGALALRLSHASQPSYHFVQKGDCQSDALAVRAGSTCSSGK